MTPQAPLYWLVKLRHLVVCEGGVANPIQSLPDIFGLLFEVEVTGFRGASQSFKFDFYLPQPLLPANDIFFYRTQKLFVLLVSDLIQRKLSFGRVENGGKQCQVEHERNQTLDRFFHLPLPFLPVIWTFVQQLWLISFSRYEEFNWIFQVCCR